MVSVVLLAIVAAANVVAQAAYGPSPPSYRTSPFIYHGCSAVDLSRFSNPVVFSDGLLTHDSCQTACQGHQFAALFPDSCRCGDDATAVTPLDESACDYPCMGDPANGMCGSMCPENPPGTSTVFTRSSPPDESPDPIPIVTAITSISLISTADPLQVSLATQPPSSVTEPSTSTAASVSTKSNQPGPTPSHRTASDDSESPPTSALHLSDTDDPQPVSLTTPTKSAPSFTPNSNSSSHQRTSSSAAASSATSFTPILGNISNAEPPEKPAGDPPAPSQVPDSNSTPYFSPALSTLGGIALVVAIVV